MAVSQMRLLSCISGPSRTKHVEMRISRWLGRRGGGVVLHQPVRGAARHQRAIQTEVNAAHGVTVRGQAPHQPSRAHIPQEDGLVVAPARKYVALGAEGETVHIVMMT